MATRVTTEPVLDRRGNALHGVDLRVEVAATGAAATLYTAKSGGSSVSGVSLTTNRDGYPAETDSGDVLFWEVGSYKYEISGLDVRDGPAERYPEAVSGSDAVLSQAGLVMLAPTTDERNVIQPSDAAIVPLTVKGAASQTEDLFHAKDSAGNRVAAITARPVTPGTTATGGSIYLNPDRGQWAPEMHFYTDAGGFGIGIDIAHSGSERKDFAIFKKVFPSGANDVVYLTDNGGANDVSIGLGRAQAEVSHRVHIQPDSATTAMGGLRVMQSTVNTGEAILVEDLGPIKKFKVGIDGSMALRNASDVVTFSVDTSGVLGWRGDTTLQRDAAGELRTPGVLRAGPAPSPAVTAQMVANSSAAGTIPLVARMAATPSVDGFRVENSAGVVQVAVNSTGQLVFLPAGANVKLYAETTNAARTDSSWYAAQGLGTKATTGMPTDGSVPVARDALILVDTTNHRLCFRSGGTWRGVGASGQTYAATNVVTDRAYDANATTLDELADVVGTLIADLRTAGIVL